MGPRLRAQKGKGPRHRVSSHNPQIRPPKLARRVREWLSGHRPTTLSRLSGNPLSASFIRHIRAGVRTFARVDIAQCVRACWPQICESCEEKASLRGWLFHARVRRANHERAKRNTDGAKSHLVGRAKQFHRDFGHPTKQAWCRNARRDWEVEMKTTVTHAISAILATVALLAAPAMARAEDSSAAVDIARADNDASSAQQVHDGAHHHGGGTHCGPGGTNHGRRHHHCAESPVGVDRGDGRMAGQGCMGV